MAEYIEREALLKAMSYHNYYPKGKHFLKGIETAEEIIEHFPAADVQPVKHGRWVESFEQIVDLAYKVKRCSICGKTKPMKIFEHEDCLFNYCPNCGARMDGET